MAFFRNIFGWLRHYMTPAFWALLLVSFVLWFIAKLSYPYTTQQSILVDVDGERFTVECTIEGVGTKIFWHKIFSSFPVKIPFEELKYWNSTTDKDKVMITERSLHRALSSRYADVKVESLSDIPQIKRPRNK